MIKIAQISMYNAKINSLPTILSADIDASVTTIPITDITVLPSAPNLITIGGGVNAETILYTGISGNDLTGCTRGFQGVSRIWSAGTAVARMFTAYDHDTFKSNIEDLNIIKENISNKNQANGYAGLDENNKILISQIPDNIGETTFKIKSAIYTSGTDTLSIVIASGSGETFSGTTINIITKTSDTTFNISTPSASTTYTIYLKNDGNFDKSTDGTIADGSIIIGTVSTNADKTVNIITDKRPLISGVGQEFVKKQNIKAYGIEWNKSTDTVTRLGDASGLTRISFDNLFPWNNMVRCNLSDAGAVNAYYGDASYKTDGTNGQCMVEIPKFWYKVVNAPSGDTNKIQFWISDNAKDGYEVHPAFYRDRSNLCDNNSGTAIEVDKRYIGTYEAVQQNGTSYVGGSGYNSSTKNYNSSYKLASVSGYSPINNITISEGRTLAKNRGNGWSQQDYYLTYAIQLLYLIEYANFNSQAQIGNGNSNSTTVLNSGATNSYGNASYGTTANTSSAMSYRGIENFYGNIYMWVDGFYCNASRNILIGKKGFNDTGSNYDYSYTTGLGSDVGGYITNIFGDKRTGFVVKVAGGSETTKLCDYGNLYASYLPAFGGYCSNGGYCGCFFLHCSYSASYSYWSFGARLAF